MIPAGYAASIVAWATRPDLDDATRTARKTQLLDLHDQLVTGQLSAKASRTLTSATLNAKTFTWLPDLTAPEKLTVINDVLGRLGLLGEAAPVTMTYGAFSQIQR